MLDELHVANLGIIGEARLEPGPGLVVVTGETGAGKTLLLGALRLLLGDAARRDQVGPASDEAVVEGRFVSPGGDEFVARRRLVPSGRSKAYVDGEMVPARVLAERTSGMAEIVGQHDELSLTRATGVRRLVDGALDVDGRRARAAYEEVWEQLAAFRRDQERIGGDARALERELDVVRYQASEIESAAFVPGEDVELLHRAGRLRNAESIAEGFAVVMQALDDETGAAAALDRAVREVVRLSRFDPSLGGLADQAGEVAELFQELRAEVGRRASDLEHDPAALAGVEGRLAVLGDLQRKYGSTLEEVLTFGKAAAERAAELTGLLERAASLEDEIAAAGAAVETAGTALREMRRAAADRLGAGAEAHLRELGFTSPVVSVEVDSAAPGPAGADAVALRFASDASLPVGPVTRIASGGELSRLVLALRLAGGAGDAPVLAFDEIDSGVGGVTALAMGRKLAEVASGRQVLCVTHLPQVAAFADAHFAVVRDDAAATVRRLEGDGRLEELSRMLAGLPDSDKGKTHAAELLAIASGR